MIQLVRKLQGKFYAVLLPLLALASPMLPGDGGRNERGEGSGEGLP
jgi:hypothetical protein